ncbi:hypothetical protein FOMPIDRAFT_1084476, partial [Fomitopsis schrenkii]
DDDDRTCPVCERWFETSQGLMSHLSMVRSCKWYRKGKNPIRIGIDIPEPVEMEELVDNNGSEDMQVDDEDFEDIIQNRDLFCFVLPDQPVDGTSSVEASSSSAPRYVTIRPPILDDDDNDRTYEEDENMAAVIAMAPTVVEQWKAYFEDAGGEDRMDVDDQENEDARGKDAKWRPFASELDWKVVSWIVREDVGQNSLNRFLSIPGVVERLGLSFKDVRELFIKVDTIPDRATWQTTSLVFPDRPEEKHFVRYRNIIEAIKALLGNPSYAKQIVWRPRRVFTDASKKKPVFSEMWTGLW